VIKQKKNKKQKRNPHRLLDLSWEYYISLDSCIVNHVYYVISRNLIFAVYQGDGKFIGLRSKQGIIYLFAEHHWDLGPPFGTIKPVLDLGSIPKNIKISIESKNLGRYLFQISEKYWFEISSIEEERKRIFLEKEKEKKLEIEKNFGPIKYFCKNCKNFTDRNWFRCPKCNKSSGFGNQLLYRLKDGKFYKSVYELDK
jgi:hypothetical protein